MQDGHGHASPPFDHAQPYSPSQPPLADPRLLIAATLAALLFAGSAAVLRGRAYALPIPRVALLRKARETPNELESESSKAKAKSPNAQAGPSNYRDDDDATHVRVHTDSADSKAAARSKDRRKRGKDVTKGKKGRALLESVGGTISHSRTPSTAIPTSPTRAESKTPNATSSSRSATPPLRAPTPGPTPSENSAVSVINTRGRSGSPDPSSPSISARMAPRGPSPRPAPAQARTEGSAVVAGDARASGGPSEGGISMQDCIDGDRDGGSSRDRQPELNPGEDILQPDRVAVERGDLPTENETETETETETEGTTAASSVVLDAPPAETVKTESASRGSDFVAPVSASSAREPRPASSNAGPTAPVAKQPSTSLDSSNPRRPHTPARLNNGDASGRSSTPPAPTSPRGAAFSVGSMPSSPSPLSVTFGNTSTPASGSPSSNVHAGNNSTLGHTSATPNTGPGGTTNGAAPNASNNSNSGTPALSLQTQLAGVRGALEAARLREEKHKTDMERMVKDLEAVRWENGVLRRTEGELHTHIRQLSYQVQQYAALLAGVAPHMQQQHQQQMQMQMQIHQMQFSAQTQTHAGLAQANPTQAQTNHAQLQRLRHRTSGSLGGVNAGVSVGVNGYTGPGIGMTSINQPVGPLPMRTHTPAQSVSITSEAETGTGTVAVDVPTGTAQEEGSSKIENVNEKQEHGQTDTSFAQVQTQAGDQKREEEFQTRLKSEEEREEGDGLAQKQQQEQTEVATQNQNEIQVRAQTQTQTRQEECSQAEEKGSGVVAQMQMQGQSKAPQTQMQNGHRHTPSAGYAGQPLPAPLHLAMLSTQHHGTMSPPAMGMISPPPTGMMSPTPGPIALGMPMPMGYAPGPFSPPIPFSPYAVSALPPWGALMQQQSGAAYHHHHQQLSQHHQHPQHHQQQPVGSGSGAPSAQHAASLFSMPSVYSTSGGGGSGTASGSSSAGSRSPDIHGSPNLGNGGGGNGIQRLQRIRHAAASRGSTRMPWEETGDGWITATSPHSYAQMDGPGAPGPSTYSDQNSDQDGEQGSDGAEGVSALLADAILKRPGSIGMGAGRSGARSRPALKNAFDLEADDTGNSVSRREDGEGDQHGKEADEEERLVEFTFPSLSDLGNPRRDRTAESTSSSGSGSASPAVLNLVSTTGTGSEEGVHPALPPSSISDPGPFAVSQIQTLQVSEDAALPAARSAEAELDSASRD